MNNFFPNSAEENIISDYNKRFNTVTIDNFSFNWNIGYLKKKKKKEKK